MSIWSHFKTVKISEAAKILNTSEAFVLKLIETNQVKTIYNYRELEIHLSSLKDYKNNRDKVSEEALQELTSESQRLGLYEK